MLRRICTDINDYWYHSNNFIDFFKSRGFKDAILNKISKDIANTPRNDLFKNNHNSLNNILPTIDKSRRIPFVTTWHQKLSGFQSALHLRYQQMIDEYPALKCIFPEPPILSFQRNKNLRNWLVHSSLTKPPPNASRSHGYSTPCSSKRGMGCKLCNSMSNTNSITNTIARKTCYTSGGKCNTTDTIYAAECTKHNLLYVGQSSQQLNKRFNGHRSDVKVKPKACELSRHFHQSTNCKIESDLKVYILQDNVQGTWNAR